MGELSLSTCLLGSTEFDANLQEVISDVLSTPLLGPKNTAQSSLQRLGSPQRCVALLYPLKGPWCPLLVVPATEPVLLANVLVLLVIIEKAQETIAHCSVCVIVNGILSSCRITNRVSSTSWHLVDVPQTFPEQSQVLLCLEGPGPCCTLLDEDLFLEM